MKHIKTYENFVNKFNFEIDKIYEYDDLPEPVRNDIDVQFDEFSEESPYDFKYKFKLLQPEEFEESIINHFGEYDIVDILEEPEMKELIEDIKKRGLDYPAVGFEGNHRALAYWFLKKPLPYLEMINKAD